MIDTCLSDWLRESKTLPGVCRGYMLPQTSPNTLSQNSQGCIFLWHCLEESIVFKSSITPSYFDMQLYP